ncbi:MAG: class I SAM-dependent methyltransferase [Candidatus Vogelbacteria bacterium]|nr:class I SAM-dependent methyltransferase [Candidatus Vogelbacteria bacterium]
MPSAYDIPFYAKGFYDHRARWMHYFNQIRFVAREIAGRKGGLIGFKALEVGPSHGQVTGYLRKFGVDVTTLDNKKEYSPDVLGSVLDMPFADKSFDMVIACEVLEHLPYEDFPKALAELRRVSRDSVLLSEPDSRRLLLGLSLKLPFLKQRHVMVKMHRGGGPVVDKGHYWEIGVRGFPLSRIRRSLRTAGFSIAEERNYLDTPRNYYFLLRR